MCRNLRRYMKILSSHLSPLQMSMTICISMVVSPIGGCQNGATGNAPNNPIGETVRNRSQMANQPWFLYVCNNHFEEDNLNHHPLITEVFSVTQGLTQLTTLLYSIIMSSVHDNKHQNCNISQYCLIGTYGVT